MEDTPKPSIEDRLEAITHTLELVSQMQLKSEERQAKTDKQIKRLGRYIRIIVMDHEQRLAALEGDEDEE